MKSQTFYLFRHGLATHSQNGYGDRALTAGLLPEAYPAVEKLADFLSQFTFNLRLVSPVLRCQQTMEVVSKKIGQEFATDNRVIEYYPEIFPPFQQRMVELTADLEQQSAECIAICTHGGVIAGLTHLLRGEQFTETNLMDHPLPAGLVILSTDLNIPISIHNFGG